MLLYNFGNKFIGGKNEIDLTNKIASDKKFRIETSSMRIEM